MLCLLGLGLMASVFLERLEERYPIPLPVVFVAVGYVAFSMPFGMPMLDPVAAEGHALIIEYLTEFIVIVSLMAAGLAIDRPIGWKRWSQGWRLLIVLMPLTIGAVAVLGWAWMGLAPASALLLGAILAPTDPVLADEVQVAPPGEDERDDIRFSLTAEAGLNDGLAFPFVHLAIVVGGAASLTDTVSGWLLEDVLLRIVVGVLVGYAVGRLGVWWVFERTEESEDADDRRDDGPIETSEGLVVIGTLFAAYGLAEVVHGYGFLAVFSAAVTARQRESSHDYHVVSHHFVDQIERIVLVVMLLGFGGLLASGILDALTWPGFAIGLGLLFVVRPILGMVAQAFCDLPLLGRAAVAFLGIRGMGTIYYLAFAQTHAEFDGLAQIWAVASFTVLASIVVHGLTAKPLLGWLREREAHVRPGQPERVGQGSPSAAVP